MHQILVINLGSTSTKIAIYEDKNCVMDHALSHAKEELKTWDTARKQASGRAACIKKWLEEVGYSLDSFSAVGLRGSNFTNGKRSGTYLVNQSLREDWTRTLKFDSPLTHAVRIGLTVTDELLAGRDIPIYTTDPTEVDEFRDEARIAGNRNFFRRSRWHALNSKAVAYKAAERLGLKYSEANLIVAHLGGGVSIAAHEQGKAVDVSDSYTGDGPFSTDRSGEVPALDVVEMCFSGKSKEECSQEIRGPKGGVMSYLGTSDMREVERRITEEKDEEAHLVFRAMAYQVAKEIGAFYAVMRGKVDAVVLTGGIAHSKRMVNLITGYVGGFARILLYPGEFENEALAFGALRVLNGEEEAIVV